MITMPSQSFLAFLLMSCVWIGVYGSFSHRWNYGDLGPDVWPDLFPICGEYQQSPINIEVQKTKYKKYSSFKLSSEYFDERQFKLVISRDRGMVASLIDNGQPFPSISGGGLYGTYKLDHFKFHWGPNYATGSEHRVDGEKTAAELHLVHRNTVTGSFAILGFLFESVREKDIHEHYVCPWQQCFQAGARLTSPEQSAIITLNLGSIIKDNLETFWRYEGSLTTPPCTEDVSWTVFTKTLQIRDINLELFRKAFLPSTFREPQSSYGRKVYRNYHLRKSGYY